MEFKVGDKIKHKKHPIEGTIVDIIYGSKGNVTAYKIETEIGNLHAKVGQIIKSTN